MSPNPPQIPSEQVAPNLALDLPNGVDGRDSGFSSGGSSGKDPSTSSGTNSGSNFETSSGGSGSNSANEGSTGSKSETKAALMQAKKTSTAGHPSTKRTLADTLPKQVETVAGRSSSNSKYRKLDEMFSNEEAKWNGEATPVSLSNNTSDQFFSPPSSEKTTTAIDRDARDNRDSRRRYRSKSPVRKDTRRDDYSSNSTRQSSREPPTQRRHTHTHTHSRNSYYPDYSRDPRDSRDRDRDPRDRGDHRDQRDRDNYEWKHARGHDRDRDGRNGWERYRPDWVQEWDTYRNRDSERARARYRRWGTEHERNSERRGTGSKNPETSAEDRSKSSELFEMFSEGGPGKHDPLANERSSRSRGVAYMEFDDMERSPRSMGQTLLGRHRDEQPETSVNGSVAGSGASTSAVVNGNAPSSASALDSVRFHRLYVGNIYFGVTEGEIIQIFEAFGPIEFADLQKEKTGKSKGYCFIQYVNPDDAKTALEEMNGFELAGRKLRVGLGLGERGATKARKILTEIGLLAADGVSRSADQVAAQIAVDRQNHKLKLQDKRDLQRENERERRASPHYKPEHEHKAPVEFTSKCSILRNMFNSNEESGNWVEELKEDVRLECEEKFGPLASISLKPDEGEILLRFHNEMDCVKAVNNLHQRYFGGRVINASHISEQDFDKKLSISQPPAAILEEVAVADVVP
ncbi:RNA-binding protein [Yarrowia sp. C11]|nr:RNA-binding protein [Yarrowia sp. C11]KAG5370916.1 RNA-binding protein [Yarrowia sp. E02]